jgi:hypothetical protein
MRCGPTWIFEPWDPPMHFWRILFIHYSGTVLQYGKPLNDPNVPGDQHAAGLKYTMHLPLSIPGSTFKALCFRQHVQTNQAGRDALQEIVRSLGKFANREKSSADVSEILRAICLPSRAEIILECMANALEAVAARDPSWLRAHAQPHWYKRYHRTLGLPKIPRNPRELEKRIICGNDGLYLLATIERAGQTWPDYLRS